MANAESCVSDGTSDITARESSVLASDGLSEEISEKSSGAQGHENSTSAATSAPVGFIPLSRNFKAASGNIVLLPAQNNNTPAILRDAVEPGTALHFFPNSPQLVPFIVGVPTNKEAENNDSAEENINERKTFLSDNAESVSEENGSETKPMFSERNIFSTPAPMTKSFRRIHIGQVAQHRLEKFLYVPVWLECAILPGLAICFYLFLETVTKHILRIVAFIFEIVYSLFRCRLPRISKPLIVNLMLFFHVLSVSFVLHLHLPISFVYHWVRAQSTFKLYVIFNILQIFDKLGSAFGQDLYELLWNDRPVFSLNFIVCNFVFWLYLLSHGLMLYIQLITLNVGINSSSASMYTLLVSNNFSELKSSVFKKFPSEVMLQIVCSDITERFQLFVFLILIFSQNYAHLDAASVPEWLSTSLSVVATIFLFEFIVDWLKHSYLCKFNVLDVGIYSTFARRLYQDFYDRQNKLEHPTILERRLGFCRYPLMVLVLRIALQLCDTSNLSMWEALMLAGWVFLFLFGLKSLLGTCILGWSCRGLSQLSEKQAEEVSKLKHIERYKLCYKRIPV